MSGCVSELTCAVYADGELSPEEARHVDAHLIGCRACRERVLALRDEGRLLTDVLGELAPAGSIPATEPAAPRSFGFPLALAASVAVAALFELWWASGTGWISRDAMIGAFFDLVFLLRTRAPGLFELVIAIAATASVSALGTFGLSALMRRVGTTVTVSLVALTLLPAPGRALETRFDEETRIAAGERVEGTLVATGERVEIDGVIAGDLFVGAEHLVLRGTVEGDVWAWSENLEISGRVEGNLFAAAERGRIQGEIQGSGYVGGHEVRFEPGASIARDLWLLCGRAVVDGSVARDLVGAVERFELRGRVGRDLDAWAQRVSLGEAAVVARNLNAALPAGVEPELEPGARVEGETAVRVFEHRGDRLGRFTQAHFWLWLLIRIGAGFVAGLLLYRLVPGLFGPSLTGARGFFRCCGLGLLALLAAPVALLLVGITIVGLPVAVLGSFVYVTALYAAGLVMAVQVGRTLLHAEPEGLRGFGRVLLAGLVVLAIAISVPWIGDAVRVVTLVAGLGLIVDAMRRALGRPQLT